MDEVDICNKKGTVGKIELTHSKSGAPILVFSLARTSRYKDGPTRTQWYKVKAWGKVAEIAQTHLHTGDTVIVMGKYEAEEFGNGGQIDHHIKANLILPVFGVQPAYHQTA